MRRPTIAIAVLLLAAGTLVGAAQAIQVTPLVRDGHVYVSFQLSDAFENEEIRAAIHSGLRITFVYDVELRRSAAAWLHRTKDSRTLDRESLAREWLTRFDRLDLFPDARLEPNAEYYVRVRARTTPRNASFVWPWQGTDVSGLAKFTFLR